MSSIGDTTEGHGRAGAHGKYSIEFVGGRHLIRVGTPVEAARLADPLALGQQHLAAAQVDFRKLAIFDVDVCAEPFDDVAFSVAQRIGAEKEPAIFAVM